MQARACLKNHSRHLHPHFVGSFWFELFRISKVFDAAIIDYDGSTVLLECTQTENRNNDLISLLNRKFINRTQIVRGGSVAVEAVSISER